MVEKKDSEVVEIVGFAHMISQPSFQSSSHRFCRVAVASNFRPLRENKKRSSSNSRTGPVHVLLLGLRSPHLNGVG